ncbi:MAG TPA: hypothetical protein VFQ68_27705, partial [Streptosporangiaceae bacterium]|nr:hypothetical protein [Streptosporangiaceae bacterium]
MVRTGPRPRLDWQNKAAAIGVWRELSGYDHPTEAIGPEPATGTPDVRSVWLRPWPPSARPA